MTKEKTAKKVEMKATEVSKSPTMDSQFLDLQREFESLSAQHRQLIDRYNQLATSNTLTFVKLMIEFLNTPGLEVDIRLSVQNIVYEFIERETNHGSEDTDKG